MEFWSRCPARPPCRSSVPSVCLPCLCHLPPTIHPSNATLLSPSDFLFLHIIIPHPSFSCTPLPKPLKMNRAQMGPRLKYREFSLSILADHSHGHSPYQLNKPSIPPLVICYFNNTSWDTNSRWTFINVFIYAHPVMLFDCLCPRENKLFVFVFVFVWCSVQSNFNCNNSTNLKPNLKKN